MMRESWLPAAPEGAPQARALVREAASELALDADTAYELMLATTEAFANAVEHGAPCDGDRIRVSIESRDQGIEVEVCDCGGCFAQNGAISRRPDGEGGRGMGIITALMDQLEVVPGTGVTRVRFGKRFVAA